MSAQTIKLVLNQQQLELLDNTIAQGVAPDREALVRLALREFSDRHGPGGDARLNSGRNG
jgi:hypothetical protein